MTVTEDIDVVRTQDLPVTDGTGRRAGLAERLLDAGLTGLGGAGFSTGVKVRAALENDAALVVNACDGELGAAKDAYVVHEHLGELVRGARAVAGDRVRYAAHRGSATEARLLAAGLPVLSVPARYVSSEETALVSLADGGLARPLVKHVPVVFGAVTAERTLPATVVLNAETVWRIDQVATRGAAWFRSYGTPSEPGPRLVTVTGPHGRSVLETEAGEPMARLLTRAGIDPATVSHLLLGGLSGTWVRVEDALDLRWCAADLATVGARTGSGVVMTIPRGTCPLDVVASHLRYAAGESAGQCGPCMFGVPAVAEDLLALVAGTAPSGTRVRLRERVAGLAGRGACRFPDGIGAYVASVLDVLGDHLDDHAHRTCPLSEELA